MKIPFKLETKEFIWYGFFSEESEDYYYVFPDIIIDLWANKVHTVKYNEMWEFSKFFRGDKYLITIADKVVCRYENPI